MAVTVLPETRPQSAIQQGVRQQIRSLPDVLITEGQHFGGRPQHGQGSRNRSITQTWAGIAHLERIAERGHLPPVCLLLQCLQHLTSLELSCVGGDAFLWMVSPVLEAARRRIQQDSRERFALEAEAESLRQSVEKMAMEVEDEHCLQLRMEERFAALLERHEKQLEAWKAEARALKGQCLEVEAKRGQLDTEAKIAEYIWEGELAELEAERSALEEDLEDLEKKMAALAFPKQKAQERCIELTEKLEQLQPDLQKKETLRQTNLRLEGEIQDLEKEISKLQKSRKKRPSRGHIKPTRNGKSLG